MRVSLQWLAEYVEVVMHPHDLAQLLTDAGTAVEGIEYLGTGLDEFIVGRVLEVRPHPAADRLAVCRVDLGGETAEIVCGAPNVKAGIAVPVALPGTRLPDGSLISQASIRGVSSRGMLLSEAELGISDEASGIMVLEGEAQAGASLVEALGLRDTVLDLEVTPNRSDCLSMLGIAREVAALTGQELRRPRFELSEEGAPAGDEVRVEISDGDLCSRYAARLIEGLTIARSPWWMRRRLQAAGVRPINNVVDVTNYVMLELGQPLHAFDYDKVKDAHILVRRAAEGEKMVTLDGVERTLTRDDLLICDPSGPIALAGVMGGEHTEVGEGTTRVLLESAHFDPANIMRTSRLQDLPSEASYRFERGVDPNGCVFAADRAAFLMRELAGGKVRPGAVDVRARVISPVRLELRVARASRLIGVPLRVDEVEGMLRSIELGVTAVRGGDEDAVIAVEVPTFRPDLEREIDLVEEVARLYGYRRIPPTLPVSPHNLGYLTREQRMRREIARILVGLGMHEAISMAFVSPRWLDALDPEREYLPAGVVTIRNPISEDMSVMRPSLLPGLLEAVRFNANRRVTDVRLFEIGRVFLPVEGEKLPREELRMGCALTGRWLPKQWGREAEEVDFFTAKGVIEGLAAAIHLAGWSLRRERLPFLHPASSCAVVINGRDAGYVGVVHPGVAGRVDLPADTAVIELALEPLVEAARQVPPFREIPRFPAVNMDLAVVVREEVENAEVEKVIREAGGALLREMRLFDLYRGGQLAEGEKSLAYSLSFYALDRTLRDEEARAAYEDIVASLRERLGGRLR